MWQTESGSHLIAPLAGAVPTKPGSATVPFFGINVCIIDPVTGVELEGNDVEGVLAVKSPWPSMARICLEPPRPLHGYLLETLSWSLFHR
ncbi:AIC_G0036560.mRNA.1.CDS.1 [Saccharomyces cerevisiae]|nr:AIC_G0036560.mRNA.1.CDS.1 [Saccharomyces cerevisiae]CAI6803266.1 AIC_G0036560.mRNA.1.CDS.1 [Saccharomyces cerevisiae]